MHEHQEAAIPGAILEAAHHAPLKDMVEMGENIYIYQKGEKNQHAYI